MFKVFDWVVDNFGKALKLPRVRVVPWSEGITELKRSMEWQNSFEKTGIDHKNQLKAKLQTWNLKRMRSFHSVKWWLVQVPYKKLGSNLNEVDRNSN